MRHRTDAAAAELRRLAPDSPDAIATAARQSWGATDATKTSVSAFLTPSDKRHHIGVMAVRYTGIGTIELVDALHVLK